tara:strand:- start:125 stop:442 length:318 start_codon:yes stop_codon:yes gene_type:complete
MAFTASVTEFGHTFADAVVEVTEANLEYRLNDYGNPAGPDGGDAPSPTTKLRINYKVYVSQEAKDAGGREIINDWDESDAGADTDIVDGNILAVAEAIVAAKLAS